MKPHFHNYLRIVDTARRPGFLLDYSGWRLCQYLPLQQADGSYTTGLSIYCDGIGIQGVVAHGETPRLIGRRAGLPIYFQFLPDEHLVFLSLCTFPPVYGPFLLVSCTLAELYCSCSKTRSIDYDKSRSIGPILSLLYSLEQGFAMVYRCSPRPHHRTYYRRPDSGCLSIPKHRCQH